MGTATLFSEGKMGCLWKSLCGIFVGYGVGKLGGPEIGDSQARGTLLVCLSYDATLSFGQPWPQPKNHCV